MKIYRYNQETGVYLGEDFADETLLKGRTVVPSDATLLAPPTHEPGYVAVFDVRAGQWMLCERPTPAELLQRARLEDSNESEVGQ